MSHAVKSRFLEKVKKQKNGCWLWTASVIKSVGYGRFGLSGHKHGTEYAHRAAWRIFVGDIPEGLYVCHKCDVRACVNPKHLFLGTARDNMHDALKKGRIKIPRASYASDESHQVAKLTNKQVLLMRSSDKSNDYWAKKFSVSRECIWAARTKRTFRDI